MPRAAGVGVGTNTPSPSSQEGRTGGSLARADATPFPGQQVVAGWGIDQVECKAAPRIRQGDRKCHRLGESRAVLQRAAVIALGLRQDAWHGVEGNPLAT
jgi:hypothetical protein